MHLVSELGSYNQNKGSSLCKPFVREYTTSNKNTGSISENCLSLLKGNGEENAQKQLSKVVYSDKGMHLVSELGSYNQNKGSSLCKPFVREYTTSNKNTGSISENCLSLLKGNGEENAQKQLSKVVYSDKGMHIFINVKGFTKEDVQIEVEGTMLKVVINKITEGDENKGKDQKTLYRRFPIPPNLNLYYICAQIDENILKITVPSIRGEIHWM